MRSYTLKWGLLVASFLFYLTAWSQTKTITGLILDETTGAALSHATVEIAGKHTAVETNESGAFTISAAPGDLLQVSYAGYSPKSVTIGTLNQLVISLTAAASSKLDEVVVVGYGTQKRREFAGSSASLNQLATKFNPSSNVGTALQGAIPGVLVRQQTGAPGSTPNIIFRGGTGFDGSGSPMVVIDGVIVPSLYGIDMNDVEDIQVLKDAASTAIYGARAANGVILVTTKRGKKGRTQVQYSVKQTYNYYRSIGENYLDAADYIRMNRLGIRARYLADSLVGGNFASDKGQLNGGWGWAFGSTFGSAGGGLYTTQKVNDANRKYISDPAWKLMIDPNPFYPAVMDSILFKDLSAVEREKMIVQNQPTTQHSLSFSGANDQGSFALNLNALKDNGTIIGSQLKRLNMNFNGGLNVGRNLKLTLNTSAYTVNQTVPYREPGFSGVGTDVLSAGTGGLLQRFVGVAPTVRYTNDTSGAILPGPNDVTLGNPLYWSQLYVNNTNEQRFTGSLGLDYSLTSYLKFIANGSGFMRYGNSNSFTKSYIQGNGGSLNTTRPASFSNYKDIQYTYNGFLQFNKDFNGHNLTVLGGGEFTEYRRYTFNGSGQGAPTDIVPWVTASQTPTVINGALAYPGRAWSDFPYWERIASAIGRLNYVYKERYFVNGVVRYDGSSRLDPSNYYGLFPGIAAGWNLHNESFYRNSKLSNYISSIKPRISYGVNGNLQNFGNDYFPTAQVYDNAGVYNGLGGTYASGYINPNVRWERTNSLNFGADLGFFNNRITVITDYFIRNVFDKLANLTISSQTGFTGYTTNLSQLQNRGFELSFNAKALLPQNTNGVSLDVGGSFYAVKSYAIKLPFNGLPGNRTGLNGYNPIEVWDPANPGQTKFVRGLVEGQRIGMDEVWAPKWAGIYTSQSQLTADANVYNEFLPYTTGIGKRFKQLGDAQWYQVYKNDTINSKQFVFVGRTTPKASGNFYFNAGYKGLHLYTAIDYAYGFVIVNNEKLRGLNQVQGSQNSTKEVLKTWTPTNTSATLPMYYWANQGRNFATDASGNNPPANVWEKGDYAMLREVSLSYDFQQALLGKVLRDKIKGLSIYVSGNNLWYLTKYSGTFPEVGGFDEGRYPLPRRVTLGAQITF
jgi:TonB-linked SusC/RagA family outer membrane protein